MASLVMDLDARVPAAFAAKYIGISRQLIRRWVELGHLEVVGRDGRSPLYRWGDLQNLDEAMRRNRRSSRYDLETAEA